jgi:death on curing protein
MVEHRSGDGEPVYLTLQDVLELHGLIIGATADVAADQLRNRAGLEGAIARPETYAHYQDADLALQAAVLAHGIAEGQQFIDANKRTALIAMLTFLEINGWVVRATDPELADWIISFSSGTPPEQVAELVRSGLHAIE